MPGKRSITPLLVLIAYLAVLGIGVRFLFQPVRVPLTIGLQEFPYGFGSWQGKHSDWLDGESYFPGVDAQLKRVYVRDDGATVSLYIGYFEVQGRGKTLVNYRADILRRDGKKIVAEFVGKGSAVYLESYPLIDGRPYATLLWYRFPDRETCGRYETKLKGITDALLHRRNSGAVIVVASPAGAGKDAVFDQETLLSFAREVQPVLETFLP